MSFVLANRVKESCTSPGTGETITNAGLFDASTSGNLFVKGDFTGIALNSGDSIAFTFKVQFS